MLEISRSESEQLDSMRGLSAIVVLVGHANQYLIAPACSSFTRYVGLFTQAAVMIFFVLSGYFIGRSLIGNIQRNKSLDITSYVKARCIRLYPPLLFATFLISFLWILAPTIFESGSRNFLTGENLPRTGFNINGIDILGSLVFLNEFRTITPSVNGPLWSLSFEAWYYVVGAAIFLSKSRPILALILFIATVTVTYSNSYFYFFLPVWLAGMGLAVLQNAWISKPRLREVSEKFAILTIVPLTVIDICSIADFVKSGEGYATHIYARQTGLLFATYLLLFLLGRVRLLSSFKSAAPYSYTLYVMHVPIFLFTLGVFQSWITSSLLNSLLIAMLSCMAIIILSSQMFRVIENKKFAEKLVQIFGLQLGKLRNFLANI